MENVHVDFFTVLIAAVLNMVIMFLWYSKWLFGPTWLKLSKTKEMGSGEKVNFLYSFLIALVIAYFIAFFECFMGVTSVSDGMFVGFCLWLGFVATTQIGTVIWSKNPFKVFLLDTGAKLLSFLVMGGVIGA